MKLKVVILCYVSALVFTAHGGWLSDLSLPKLTDAQKEWHMYPGRMPPEQLQRMSGDMVNLRVLSDGYKLIETYRAPERKGKHGNISPAYDAVRWGWQLTMKNTGTHEVKVFVIYVLQDSDGFSIAGAGSVGGEDTVPPGMTVTLRGTDSMRYDQLKKLANSSWTF